MIYIFFSFFLTLMSGLINYLSIDVVCVLTVAKEIRIMNVFIKRFSSVAVKVKLAFLKSWIIRRLLSY